MHHKAIKAQIRKQLKIRYLNWYRLSKKEKKAVAKKVLNEVVANYDFKIYRKRAIFPSDFSFFKDIRAYN